MNSSMRKFLISSLSETSLSQIGLAQRARKVITGEGLMKAIRANSVSLVVIATDASDRTKKQITSKCEFYNIQYVIQFTIKELSNAIGKSNRVALGISDNDFKKMILNDNKEVVE